MASAGPPPKISELKRYFDFTLSEKRSYSNLRKQIQDLMLRRKVTTKSGAGIKVWETLLDDVQELSICRVPPLSEKFQNEREVARRYLSRLVRDVGFKLRQSAIPLEERFKALGVHVKDEDIQDEDIQDEDIQGEDIQDEDIQDKDIQDEARPTGTSVISHSERDADLQDADWEASTAEKSTMADEDTLVNCLNYEESDNSPAPDTTISVDHEVETSPKETISSEDRVSRPPHESIEADEQPASTLTGNEEDSPPPTRPQKRKAEITDRSPTEDEDDESELETELKPRAPKRICGFFFWRALCAYALVPGTSTPKILASSLALETISLAELCTVISRQISRDYFPKAVYGLPANCQNWSTPPPTMTRLMNDHQIKAWVRLFYPNLKDDLYIYVVLHKKGQPLDPVPDGELPYMTEEEYATFQLGGDGKEED